MLWLRIESPIRKGYSHIFGFSHVIMYKLGPTEILFMLEEERIAWCSGEPKKLSRLFHPDFLYISSSPPSVDPIDWRLPLGKAWTTSLAGNSLGRLPWRVSKDLSVIRRIEVSPSANSALVVQDIRYEWIPTDASSESSECTLWNEQVTKLYGWRDEWRLMVQIGANGLHQLIDDRARGVGALPPDESNSRQHIMEVLERESRAWSARDVDGLLSVFHPDAVWPFLFNRLNPSPMVWRLTLDRFDSSAWGTYFQRIFEECAITKNVREVKSISFSTRGDQAIAVLDIDTAWLRRDGEPMRWVGRVAKVFSIMGTEWRIMTQYGPVAI